MQQVISFDAPILDSLKFRDEREVLRDLLDSTPLSPGEREEVGHDAQALVRVTRQAAKRQGVVENFLQEFSLSTREGLALMCLAEALLRTPDDDTRDRLIAEKVASADWVSHLGQSESLLVNASTVSLMLTGKLVEPEEDLRSDFGGFILRLAGRLGEPMIRRAVAAAVRIMGEQFVLGRTIEAAIKRAKAEGYVCSFDMLGEGARTQADAIRYEEAYAAALEAVGRNAKGLGPEAGHGVSVKLSALSPRYEARQEALVWSDLYPRLLRLAQIAAKADINLTLDAEEADRLVISLNLLSRLASEPSLGAWRGLGLAVQAYQRRAVQTVAMVADIARTSGRRLMVRLVKGAYWDSEIKRAQVQGLPSFPVFTTKAATDLSYLACAKALIASAPDLYPQFATHNAHTLAAVRLMAQKAGVSPEFQRLHGMGEALYSGAAGRYGPLKLRVYAPVGGHEDLLPYLVRRLLENGANTSFVHALLDEKTPAAAVVADPISAVDATGGAPHPKIAAPSDLYGTARRNSQGLDLSISANLDRLTNGFERKIDAFASPILNGEEICEGAPTKSVSPGNSAKTIGQVWSSTPEHIEKAFAIASSAQPAWDAQSGAGRAPILRAMADALEQDRDRLVALCTLEAGKTFTDGVAEVREAADFCRYYAHLAERQFSEPEALKGPVGESNHLSLHGRGVIVAISPWNFPLAIFTGQIAAALAAGNAVIAKPAEQTPLVAAAAVRLFQEAGLPPGVLSLLPGSGLEIGGGLVAHPQCAGVAFTGGTETAWAINRSLAARPGPIVPLVAETGGLNAMVVDTTALREQVIDDVIASAFGAAGQRCSALRILFAPEPTADSLIAGLVGAMDALVIGDPQQATTDIGPVIDAEARDGLMAHLDRLKREAEVLHEIKAPETGFYFGPVLAEIPSAAFLEREVFGPVLHVVRYDPAKIDEALAPLRAAGYGLTLGVHSRIEGFSRAVQAKLPSGNTYINRSMIGAVVGVQPFGGEGLSGTGPKAGGPHALLRFVTERAISINIAAQGGDPALLNLNA